MISFVAAFDNLYNQNEAGLLREEVFVSIASSYYSMIKMPGVQQLLQENAHSLPPYLLDYSVNDILVGKEKDFGQTLKFLNN